MNQFQSRERHVITEPDSRAFDVVRLMANYMIVVMHSWSASQYCIEGTIEFKFWNFVCNAFSAAAMPALFLMSGYLLMFNFAPGQMRAKMYRRVKRLLIPLIVWNLSFVVFYLVAAKFIPRIACRVDAFDLGSIGGIVNKIVGLIDRPLDAPLWYLKTVFIYSVFALPIWWLLNKRKGIWLCVVALAALLISVFTSWGHPMKFSYPAYSVITFLIGCYLGYNGLSVFNMFASKLWLFCPIIGSVMVYFWLVASGGVYAIWRDIGFLLMLPFLFTIGPWFTGAISHFRFYPFALRSSFFVYAGHFFFCSIMLHTFAHNIQRFIDAERGSLTVLIIFFCTVGLAVNLLAYSVGKRCLGRLFGMWDGSL